MIIDCLVGEDRDPLVYLLAEIGLTKHRERQIHDLLIATGERAEKGDDRIDIAVAFQTSVGEIVGKRLGLGDHVLAASIVSACEEANVYRVAVGALRATTLFEEMPDLVTNPLPGKSE